MRKIYALRDCRHVTFCTVSCITFLFTLQLPYKIRNLPVRLSSFGVIITCRDPETAGVTSCLLRYSCILEDWEVTSQMYCIQAVTTVRVDRNKIALYHCLYRI
jgi:hypothetical protein